MMIRNIVIFTLNYLAISFKNKTIYLILFIPFFVFFSLELVDSENTKIKNINIGLIPKEMYAPDIQKALITGAEMFTVYHVANEEEGGKWLKEKKIDGLLLKSEKVENSLVLVVLKKEALTTLAIVESFSALQKTVEAGSINWLSEIRPLQEEGIQKQTLPTWILMLVLLVSFIILPAQVAEEKEKKLLLALLQTPMREIEWLIAKLLLGMILILIAVLSLHLMGKFKIENTFSYAAFMAVGSFCFSSYGIFLGFLCRNQASARTLGVIFYLPHLLPSALSDFSQKLTAIAPFLPSYLFYEPIKSILLDGGGLTNIYEEAIYLLFIGLLTFIFSYLLIKKRWLM
jgi:ABC-2 type transport system permease protein